MSENFFCGPKTQVTFPDLGLDGTCLDYRAAEMSRLGGDECRKDALYGMCTANGVVAGKMQGHPATCLHHLRDPKHCLI
jgi:hypothetical protein